MADIIFSIVSPYFRLCWWWLAPCCDTDIHLSLILLKTLHSRGRLRWWRSLSAATQMDILSMISRKNSQTQVALKGNRNFSSLYLFSIMLIPLHFHFKHWSPGNRHLAAIFFSCPLFYIRSILICRDTFHSFIHSFIHLFLPLTTNTPTVYRNL